MLVLCKFFSVKKLNFISSHFKSISTLTPIVKFQVFYVELITAIQTRFKSQSGASNLNSLLQSMPKDPKHIAKAQKHRQKIKERSSKYVPSKVTLQVLGTGAEGAPRCLYVFSDQARYLFNCGEGSQRLAHEHKMKLAKLEHIFVTQPVWKNMGGLPGTALTIQEVGVPQITLHGPGAVNELFKATKKFVIMKNLKIKMAECNENAKFTDNVMTVEYVPLIRVRQGAAKFGSYYNLSALTEESDVDKGLQVGVSEMANAATTTRNSRKRRRSKSKTSGSDISDDDTDYYAHESKVARSRGRSRRRSLSSRSSSVSGSKSETESTISQISRDLLIETKEKGIIMAYICRLQARPGALNLDKCVELGVPAGPLLGLLKSGQEVELEDGRVIKPSDVCEPDDPGPLFIVVDCPTSEYIDSVLASNTLAKHKATATSEEDFPSVIVHFTPMNIFNDPKYQAWVDSFSPSTQHLLINDGNTCLGSASVHRIQYKLNMLSKDMFPLLGDTGSEVVTSSELEKSKQEYITNKSITKARGITNWDGVTSPKTFCSYHLRPRWGLDSSTGLKISPTDYINETIAIDNFSEELTKLKVNLSTKIHHVIRAFPKILFLGTGSCIPNKTRNTSGILLRTSETSNILMDCGEGTYGQLVRFFGLNKYLEVLAQTDAIYISHLHADHHIGLIGFMQGRRRARELLKMPHDPVYLFAPKQIMSWLNFYDDCFEDISDDYVLIPNSDLLLKSKIVDEHIKFAFDALSMKDISTCFVKHCPNAFGVTFVHKSEYKITYSGDTMPSDNLIELGMNSDLLIHEATMEDELAHEALTKMHSTTSQAITVGARMKAKNILLTHFSQRYAKLPRFNDNFKDNIGIAFDNMQVRLDELPLVPLLYPALKLMFAEHYEELEQKAVKRQLKQQRERSVSRDRKTSQNRELSKERSPSKERPLKVV